MHVYCWWNYVTLKMMLYCDGYKIYFNYCACIKKCACVHYSMRWRIRHCLSLNIIIMESCHFAKSFIERGLGRSRSGMACCRFVGWVAAGRESFATAISTRCWQWSSVRCGCLNTKCCKSSARPSNSTSTPRWHDRFFPFCTPFLGYLWKLLFSVWREYSLPGCVVIYFSVSSGRHSEGLFTWRWGTPGRWR